MSEGMQILVCFIALWVTGMLGASVGFYVGRYTDFDPVEDLNEDDGLGRAESILEGDK